MELRVRRLREARERIRLIGKREWVGDGDGGGGIARGGERTDMGKGAEAVKEGLGYDNGNGEGEGEGEGEDEDEDDDNTDEFDGWGVQ
ncbi:hypothetical protein EPUS_00703 [Endocarpon pusillum Z07020]|uniref:Uncharacterized protein n=1 Tax=Endocarpon pusillum (strain Z07020 / HMAS-L-300199) TaxID=1263415 RepID=U1GQF7_ENDPU|nr:uncharacterized protein EPUS_00703 [Endocarpon pusillum Z07020]ERF74573.1 hypothetical protein EPUS_00703 [Endocarpon pusillum Z07020]